MNSRQIAITTLPKNRVQQTTSPNGKAGALATAMRLFRNRKETPTIEKADPDIPQPLSYAQELLWLFQQINPESTVYNRVHAFRLQGTLNISALEKAINEIMRRHTILRTTYHLADDQPIQRVLPHRAEQLEVMDLRGSAMETARDRYLPYLQAQMTQPFDISQEKICRFQLLQMAEEDFILVFCVHHIGYDVSSERVLFRELGILYEAFCLNKPSPLPELAIQYSDYAAWQRQSLNDVLLLEKLDFHQQLLDSELPLLELPSDMPRLNEVDTQGKTHIIPLDPELSQALRRLSQNEGVSFFDTMLTVFYVLLYRYTYQEKVVVGTPVTNRNQADLHKLLTLPSPICSNACKTVQQKP